MIKQWIGFLLGCSVLFAVFSAHAIRLPPTSNIEILGFISVDGKAAEHAKIELRKGSCFGETSSFTWADEKGYYRLFEPQLEAGDALYVYVAAGQSRLREYESYCLFDGFKFSVGSNHEKKNHSIALKSTHQVGDFSFKSNSAITNCGIQGGIWGELKPKQFGCNLKFKDAGKSCTDANQCQSKVCFSEIESGNAARLPASMRLKPTGFCAVDTYQALNKRPGAINGEYRAGKLITYP